MRRLPALALGLMLVTGSTSAHVPEQCKELGNEWLDAFDELTAHWEPLDELLKETHNNLVGSAIAGEETLAAARQQALRDIGRWLDRHRPLEETVLLHARALFLCTLTDAEDAP